MSSNRKNKRKTNSDQSNKHPLIIEWEKLKKNVDTLDKQSNAITQLHDLCGNKQIMSPHRPDDLEKIEKLLQELSSLSGKFDNLENKLLQVNHDELVSIKKNLLDLKWHHRIGIWILKKAAADKYIFAGRKYDRVAKKIEKFTRAETLLREIQADLFDDARLDGALDHFTKLVATTLTEVITELREHQPNGKIEELIVEACSNSDKDAAYQVLANAYQLAETNGEKFHILFHQGKEYYKHHKLNQDKFSCIAFLETEEQLNLVKKSTQPFIPAIGLFDKIPDLTAGMIAKYSQIYSGLLNRANLIINYTKDKSKTTLEDKLNNLIIINLYIKLANTLYGRLFALNTLTEDQAQILSDAHNGYKDVPDRAADLENQLMKKKQEELTEKQKSNQNQTIDHDLNEAANKSREEKIKELILEAESKKKKSKRTHKNISHHSQSLSQKNIDTDSDSDDENRITVFNPVSVPVATKIQINVFEQKCLLKKSQNDVNYLDQIKINVVIAEYYYVEGKKFSTISDFISARNYLLEAHSIFQKQFNSQSSLHHVELENCITIVLENLAKTLKKFILNENRIIKLNQERKAQRKASMSIEEWCRGDKRAIQRDINRRSHIAQTMRTLNKLQRDIESAHNTYFQAEQATTNIPVSTANEVSVIQSTHLSTANTPASTVSEVSVIQSIHADLQDEESTTHDVIIADIINLYDAMLTVTDPILKQQFEMKLFTAIEEDKKMTREMNSEMLTPLFNESDLTNAIFLNCIEGKSVVHFDFIVRNNYLPYMLPIPFADWSLTKEKYNAIRNELQELDQKITLIYTPKESWELIARFVMAILSHTEMLYLPFVDLKNFLGNYLEMNPLLEKSIELSQKSYLIKRHPSNQVNSYSGSGLTVFSAPQSQMQVIQQPTVALSSNQLN